MKDKQIKEVMGSIENRIRHIYNCGYQQGYEDGKKAVNEQTEKITYADIDEAYQRGLEDAWKCARKLRHPRYGGYYDHEQLDIFGYENSDDVLTNFTADQAMQKIKDYESTINYHDDFATALEKMHDYEERQKEYDIKEDFDEETRTVRYTFVPKKERQTEKSCMTCKHYYSDGCFPMINCHSFSKWEQMRKENHD